jgi:uridine kinase
MLDFEKIIARIVEQSPPRLVAIDGLPLAGKLSLADRLALALGTECVRLDGFVKPRRNGAHMINRHSPSITSAMMSSWPR